MTSSSLDWKGDVLKKRIRENSRLAIDETTSSCVAPAKSQLYKGHGRITGIMQGSIQFRPAAEEGNRIVGRWGSFDVNYTLFNEVGTARRPGYHMLRIAADQEYPKLKARIAERMKGNRGQP